MILLDPKNHNRPYSDVRSSEIMRKTIAFFEGKGKQKLLEDYYDRPWYADFLEFNIHSPVSRFRIMPSPSIGASAKVKAHVL